MMLTSVQNPWVKQLRKLHQVKGRREAQLCLLEGTHLVDMACQVQGALVSAAYTEVWQQKYPQLSQCLQARCERVEVVSEEVLRAIATTVHPDGVVATLRRVPSVWGIDQIRRFGLVLAAIQDPGNLGTLIRTGAAVGVDGIWLSSDCVELDHPKVLRASAGAWFRVKMTVEPNLSRFMGQCRQNRCQVIATTAAAEESYWEVDWRQPSVIVLGNAGAGLSSELLGWADKQVKIPMSGGVESLNVAIAGALMLYEAQRQWTLGVG